MEGLRSFLNIASQKLIFLFVFPIGLWLIIEHSKTVFPNSRQTVLSMDSDLDILDFSESICIKE